MENNKNIASLMLVQIYFVPTKDIVNISQTVCK